MEKANNLQLELFTEEHLPKPRHSLWRRIRGYEKIIIALIGFFMTSLVSFSLGVEKGKSLAVTKKTNAYLNLAIAPEKKSFKIIEKVEPESLPTIEVKLQAATNKYTIQLASYQSRSMAKKEVENLKTKGLKPLILSKGKYIIVCVGNFPEKKLAQGLFSQLKKRYRDCLIRRL